MAKGLKTVVNIQYDAYQKKHKNSPIAKDACENCKSLRAIDTREAKTLQGIKGKTYKHTFEFVFNTFKERNYILLSTTYDGNRQPLQYLCPFHGEQTITFQKLLQGQGCKLCGYDSAADKCKHEYEFVRQEFVKRNYLLLEDKYINQYEKMSFICLLHPEHTQETNFTNMNRKVKGKKVDVCYYCYLEKVSGENNHNWLGGITDLNNYLRSQLDDWKRKSLQKYNYKCVISGVGGTLDIHHLYSFNKIVKEVLLKLDLPVKVIVGDYTNEQLSLITYEFLFRHDEFLGVPLTKEIHALYHAVYKDDNTPEQFEEFKQRFLQGEFNKVTTFKTDDEPSIFIAQK
jgi:hypothetical protein